MLLFCVSLLLLAVAWFSVDDLFIDLIALLRRLGPKELTDETLSKWRAMPEKNIAIMVANWHEAEVIGKMVSGNNLRLEYQNFHFFIGVYPNDSETLEAAQRASRQFKNVHVVINQKDGPTTKGQMLNEIARGILRREGALDVRFDVFLMHDSEDILHPLALKLINAEISRAEFLQTPVFSFDRGLGEWVGSTYIDEFAEIHTKDMFVRESLGAPLPSAGVGTALQRSLILALILEGDGGFLREDSLTEDYVLGMSAALRQPSPASIETRRRAGISSRHANTSPTACERPCARKHAGFSASSSRETRSCHGPGLSLIDIFSTATVAGRSITSSRSQPFCSAPPCSDR